MIDNNLWKFYKNRMLNSISGEWPEVSSVLSFSPEK